MRTSYDDATAEHIGQAIVDLLDLTQNDYPGEAIRFDTSSGDKTLQGLARTIARIFEDEQFRLGLGDKS